MKMLNKRIAYCCIILLLTGAMVQGQEIKSIRITELETIIEKSEKPLVVNFWATWCKPCIEEIPYFQEMAREKDVDLLLVSLDLEEAWPKQLAAFIKKRKFSAPVVWLNETNADYFCPKVDSSWSGAIPASLFINHLTGYRKFIGEQLSKEKLETELMMLLRRLQ